VEKHFYRECGIGRRFIIKIQPGAKVVQELLEFAKSVDLKFASVVSAVGSVREVEFMGIQAGANLPISGPRMKTHHVDGPLGLMGIEGNIAKTEAEELNAHLHIIASKSNGEVVGGHLLEAEVFATCEIVLAEYIVQGVERYHSATGGVDTLFIEEKQNGSTK
jgi:hypothetical protein